MSSTKPRSDHRVESALALAAVALMGLELVVFTGSLVVKIVPAALAVAAGVVAFRLARPAHTDTTTFEE